MFGLLRTITSIVPRSQTKMPQYISNHELAALIRNPDNQMRKNIAVVDVRDDDYPGGNIVDVIHSPSATFNLEVNQLIDDLKDVKKVM
jgi:Cdc25 family phosphatase